MTEDFEARLVAAIESFARKKPYLGCVHVVRDGAGAQLCTQHPGAGLLCSRCTARHVRRHDPVEELTCAMCRSFVAVIHPCVATLRLVCRPGRDPKGHHRSFDARLAVIGAGRCVTCLVADDIKPTTDMLAVLAEKGWRP